VSPRITVIGGGSHQWVPSLVTDIARQPSLADAELVLEDIDADRLPRMERYVRHVAGILGLKLSCTTTTDQRAALDGAEYVVVNISTGGFASMRHDLEIPARYGLEQSVGDTVGPGGISRALRNIPVLVGIARDMESMCPDAWLLNLTNPMTTLCRAVTRETPIRAVGLCHEVSITQVYLWLLLGVDFMSLRPTITGVNHLPVITALDAGGRDGLAMLSELLAAGDLGEELPGGIVEAMGHEPRPDGRPWTKADLVGIHQIKLELFARTGALPAAGDRHLAEFFAGFLTEQSGQGRRWGVKLTTIAAREADEAGYVAALEEKLARDEVSPWPSGEMVHTVIDSLMTGTPAELPLNIPNAGQCPDLPAHVVVESMCLVDRTGISGRDVATAPPLLAEQLRRVSASQELVVEAAVQGSRDAVLGAMLLDPLASRIDYDALGRMTDELLAATASWLPQFA
jgi:alpha-galactosidase/6-phospho-beta-glucosidase family protein